MAVLLGDRNGNREWSVASVFILERIPYPRFFGCSERFAFVCLKFGERLFAVHGLSERTTVQTSSLLLRLFFFTSWPTRPISLTLTQTPTPADRVVPIHSWRPLGHSTVWADFVCVSGSVLYLVRTQSKK